MEQELFRRSAYDMLYLTRMAVRGEIPDAERVQNMDLDALFKVCQKHILTACVDYALESAGIRNPAFVEAKEKAVRKNILLDADRSRILRRLEQEKIWYMPLKGAILKDWYPKSGMRQMSDNDILCDPDARRRIRDLMLDMGFTCAHFEMSNEDAYFKPPVGNFEIHPLLFAMSDDKALYAYYETVRERLIPDSGSEYGYHFRTEDFYLYMLAHEYKHYIRGGVGVRSMLDVYVFLKKHGDTMDDSYLAAEMEKLGITAFEAEQRMLAEKLFGDGSLTEEDRETLEYYIFSGAYGTKKNRTETQLKRLGKRSRSKYVFGRIFPSMDLIKTYWPFFYRHKFLIPLLLIYRAFRALTVGRRKVSTELRTLRENQKKS